MQAGAYQVVQTEHYRWILLQCEPDVWLTLVKKALFGRYRWLQSHISPRLSAGKSDEQNRHKSKGDSTAGRLEGLAEIGY